MPDENSNEDPRPSIVTPDTLNNQSLETESQTQVDYDQEEPTMSQSTPDMEAEATTPEPVPTERQNPFISNGNDSNTQPSGDLATDRPAKKRSTILVAVIAAGFVILAGAGASAYTFWYQNPEKVVLDSVVNALKAKTVKASGSVSIVTKEVNVTLTPEFQGNEKKYSVNTTIAIEANEKEYEMLDDLKFEVAAISELSGDTFIKFSQLAKLYDGAVEAYISQVKDINVRSGGGFSDSDSQLMRDQLDAYVKPIIDKIDDQWILSTADNTNETSKTQECLASALKTLKDESNLKELAGMYQANKFVYVKQSLGSKDGSLGYRLGYDNKKAESFSEASGDTTIGKAFNECDENDYSDNELDTTKDEAEDKNTATIDIWVSRWTHEITKLEINAVSDEDKDETVDITISPVFDAPVSIKSPENAKSIEEISRELKLLQASGAVPAAI